MFFFIMSDSYLIGEGKYSIWVVYRWDHHGTDPVVMDYINYCDNNDYQFLLLLNDTYNSSIVGTERGQ